MQRKNSSLCDAMDSYYNCIFTFKIVTIECLWLFFLVFSPLPTHQRLSPPGGGGTFFYYTWLSKLYLYYHGVNETVVNGLCYREDNFFFWERTIFRKSIDILPHWYKSNREKTCDVGVLYLIIQIPWIRMNNKELKSIDISEKLFLIVSIFIFRSKYEGNHWISFTLM